MEWVTRTNDLNHLTQGSIVDGVDWDMEDNPVSIVLSNACDLEHGHTPYLLVAALYPASSIILSSREFNAKTKGKPFNQLTSGERKDVNRLISDYIHHRTVNRYYFIDCRESDLEMYMMVDFHQIKSIPLENKQGLTLIANLKSPLKEQMMMQYVCHAARIPTDRVDNEIEKSIIEDILNGI